MKESSIFIFVGKLSVGGAGKIVRYVSTIAKEKFDRVVVVSFYEKTKDIEVFSAIEYIGLEFKSTNKYWRYDAIKKLRSLIKENKPNVCCAFVSDIAVMVRLATLFIPRLTFVSAERGDPYTLSIIWKILVAWTYKHSDYCIFQLPKARDFFCSRVIKKSFVIPNPYLGQNQKPYEGIRKSTVVTATRFEKEKGVDLLIDAFKTIHLNHPDYKLILYGDGSLKGEYEKKVKEMEISDSVCFPGYIKNVAETVKAEGLFVLPSRYEGIPNTLIEVLAVGMPTISADCSPGGPRFLTQDGKIGLLFPVGNKQSLIDKIELLINNKNLASRLSKTAPSIVNALYEPKIRMLWSKTFEEISHKTVL